MSVDSQNTFSKMNTACIVIGILLRWVCTSGSPEDLEKSDKIATDVLENFMKQDGEFQAPCYSKLTIYLCKIPAAITET